MRWSEIDGGFNPMVMRGAVCGSRKAGVASYRWGPSEHRALAGSRRRRAASKDFKHETRRRPGCDLRERKVATQSQNQPAARPPPSGGQVRFSSNDDDGAFAPARSRENGSTTRSRCRPRSAPARERPGMSLSGGHNVVTAVSDRVRRGSKNFFKHLILLVPVEGVEPSTY